jgi:anti-sigma regulatory factor (Ser/Thr protein kinase)
VARSGIDAAFHAEDGMASSPAWPRRTYLELAALPTAVSCARLHARVILHEWHVPDLTDAVELLVSEILTNAVRASASQPGRAVPVVRFWLATDGRRVLIQAWDGDARPPEPQHASLDAESGRGLLLVDAISADWGYHAVGRGRGKIVWAICAA